MPYAPECSQQHYRTALSHLQDDTCTVYVTACDINCCRCDKQALWLFSELTLR